MIPIWQMMLGIGVGLVTLFIMKQRRALPNAAHGGGGCSGRSGYNSAGSSQQTGPGTSSNGSARFRSMPGDPCVICLNDMHNEDMMYMQCGHALHDECYESCRNYTKCCPVCRQRL